jgi:putative heme iron utilization protein
MKNQDKLEENGFSGTAMRQILRRAATCSLSTLGKQDAIPYGSLANMATDVAGKPILLLSNLAWHTQNLRANPRASVLVSELPASGDALMGARVTVLGRIAEDSDETLRRRYLARHPNARLYAGFADFSFWRLQPSNIHGVAGFGRIETLTPSDVFPDAAEFESLELSALEHLNNDHADSIHLYATKILGGEPGQWQVTALDPDGCDLGLGEHSLRLNFAAPVFTADALRQKFTELAYEARTQIL